MARVAAELGLPLMPWQRLVADVSHELLEDGTPAYREVICSVPRQCGKTTLLLAIEVHRALQWRSLPQKIAYSAQTGQDARKKLLEDQVPILQASPLAPLVARVYRTMGAEGVVFRTRSRISVVASSEASGHGGVFDLAVIDEAFADEDERREQAVKPAMMTKPDAQLYVFSTAGDEGSVYLRRKVDAGRAAVADGVDGGIAYFEWSADPEADIRDPATWWSCIPALGHTISEKTVRHDLTTMTEGNFRRASTNQWTVAEERVIPALTWAAVCADDVAPAGELVFAVDAAPDRGMASIVAADVEQRCELVEHREGVSWLVARVIELATKHHAAVAVDSRGPAGSVVPDLEAGGVRVTPYGPAEMAGACARFYDAVGDGKVRVRRHADLDSAAAAARKRISGDSWYWARSSARTDISPLVALTLAHDLSAAVLRRGAPWVQWS